MSLFGMLNRRVRGFRVLELVGFGVLTAVVLTVYLAKTGAGDKRDDIDRVEAQIEEETTQIRLLRAEVATEERPERLEALAGQYLGLQPVSVKHEIEPEALADVAQIGKSAEPRPGDKPAPPAGEPTTPPPSPLQAAPAPTVKATHASIAAAATASVSTLQHAAYTTRPAPARSHAVPPTDDPASER